MGDTTYVNLHTHTAFSDGAPTPETLADRLAGAGVRYAALTDHDTVEGQARFRAAMEAKGIPTLSGLELTTELDGRLAHLVAYGFEPSHQELVATLARMRHGRDVDFHSIASSLRAAGRGREAGPTDGTPAVAGVQNGHPATADAIALIHRAGGRAFLAHPLVLEPDLVALETLLPRLKALGMDGIEATYAEFSTAQQAALIALARKYDLLTCAGTDYHGIEGLGSRALGIDMPQAEWLRFRAALLDSPTLAQRPTASDVSDPAAVERDSVDGGAHTRRRPFGLRVVLPTLAAMALFLVALWGVLLPSFEQTLLERKREMIRELADLRLEHPRCLRAG